MSTERHARIFIKNDFHTPARIHLWHHNDLPSKRIDRLTQKSWWVQPGEVAGPMVIHFDTGWGARTEMDYWAVRVTVESGQLKGVYGNEHKLGSKWKECQLRHHDMDKDITFSVSQSEFKLGIPSGGCSRPVVRLSPYNKIGKVFVLMLENHSFDNIFAFSGILGIKHANRRNFNHYHDKKYFVKNAAPYSMPTDPGHEFQDVFEQLTHYSFAKDWVRGGRYPESFNSGFVKNYATSNSESTGLPKPSELGDVMGCYDTRRTHSNLYNLATNFAICDKWFSSLPGPTWPNRFFVHGASSNGMVEGPSTGEILKWVGTEFGFKYPKGSIFDALKRAKIPYSLYNDRANRFIPKKNRPNITELGDIPQVASIDGIHLTEINDLGHFTDDLRGPFDPCYVFIEPNYGTVRKNTYKYGSSQHPMDSPLGGEGLIQFVYESIRNSPYWEESLLIITYDEHGGFYDSVKPPRSTPPNDGGYRSEFNKFRFRFDSYGVRVPAVVVSPRIKKGAVDHKLYDHASVAATLEEIFDIPWLTDRDKNANSLIDLLGTVDEIRTDCPTSLGDTLPFQKITHEQEVENTHDDFDLNAKIPESGNYIGTLFILFKTHLELTESEEEKQNLMKEFRQLKTFGDVETYLDKIIPLIEDARKNSETTEK